MHSHDSSHTDSLPFRKSSLNTYNSDANVDFVDYGGTRHKTPSISETGQEHMDNASQSLSMQSNTKQHGSSGPSGDSRLSTSELSVPGQESKSSTHIPSTPIGHTSDQGHNDTQIRTIHEPYHRSSDVRSVGTNAPSPIPSTSSGTPDPAQKKRTTWYGFEVPVGEKTSKKSRPLSLGFGYKERVASFKSAKGTSAGTSLPTIASSSQSSSAPVVNSVQPQHSSTGREPIVHPFSPSQDRPVHVAESYNTSNMPKGHYLMHPSPFKSKKPSTPRTLPEYIPPNMRRSHVPPPPSPSAMRSLPLTAPIAATGGAASARLLPSTTPVSTQPQHLSATAIGKQPIPRSFSPSQDRPVHVVESYHTSDMPKGHYLTHPSSSKSKEPSAPKTAPTTGGVASAMPTSSAAGSGQPQHPNTTATRKQPIARSFSPSQDRPVHVVESYHTSDMPKGHYLTHPSSSKSKDSSMSKTAPTVDGAASTMSTSSATGSGQPQHSSTTAIGKQPIPRSFSPSQDRPVHVVESYHTSNMPKGHYLMHKEQKDDPTLYPTERGLYSRKDQDQRNNIKDSPSRSLPLTSPGSSSMAVPIVAGTTAAALGSAADVPINHVAQPSTHQRELKKPVPDLLPYEEEEGAYLRGGDERGPHGNSSLTIGATEETQLDADKMHAHHNAHQSMTDKMMGALHELHMPAILGSNGKKDKEKEETEDDNMEATGVATTAAVAGVGAGVGAGIGVGIGAGIGAFAAGTTGLNKGVGAGIGALAAGAIVMKKSLKGRKTPSSIKPSSTEEKMLSGPSLMDKPVTDSETPSTVMAPSSETSTLPNTVPSVGGVAEATDTPAMGSMTPPTANAPSIDKAAFPIAHTMPDTGDRAAGPAIMNRTMIDSQAPLPAKSSSTKTSAPPTASKVLGAGAGAAGIAAALRARTPEPHEMHGTHADMPVMDEDPTSISARKVEPVIAIPPVDSVLVTDKATMTRSTGSTIPYTSATMSPDTRGTKTPDAHATAFDTMNSKHDANAGTGTKILGTFGIPSYNSGAAHATTKRDDSDHKELDVQGSKTTEHSAPAVAAVPAATGGAMQPARTHINKAAETTAAAIPTAAYAAYVHKPHDKAEYDSDMYESAIDGPSAHKRDDHGHIVLEEYDHNRIHPMATTHAAVPIVADDTASEVDDPDPEMIDNDASAIPMTSTTAGPAVKPTETDFNKTATALPVAAYATYAHGGKEKTEYDSDEQKETGAKQTDHIFVDKSPDTVVTASPHKTDENIAPDDEIEMFPESVGSTSKAPPAEFLIDTVEETPRDSGKDVQMDPMATVEAVEAVGNEGDEEVAAEEIMETKETDIEPAKKEKKPHVSLKKRISNATAPKTAAITAAAVAYKARQPDIKKRQSLRIKEDDVHKPTVPIVRHRLAMTEDDVNILVVPKVSYRLTLTEDDVYKPVPRLSALPVLRLTEDDVEKPDPSTARYPVIPKVEPKLVSTSALKVANAPRPMIPDQPTQGRDIKLPAMRMPKMSKVSKPKLPKVHVPEMHMAKFSKPKLPKVHMPRIGKRKSKVAPEPVHVSPVVTTTGTTAEAPVVEPPIAEAPVAEPPIAVAAAVPRVDAVASAVEPRPIFVEGDKTEIPDAAVMKDESAMTPVVPMTEAAEAIEPVVVPTPIVQESARPRMVEGPVKKPVIVPAAAVPVVAAVAATTHPSPPLSPLPVAQTPIPAPAPVPAPSPPAPALSPQTPAPSLPASTSSPSTPALSSQAPVSWLPVPVPWLPAPALSSQTSVPSLPASTPSPPAPAPVKTPTIFSNVASPPAGYTGSIPKVDDGESLIWIKRIYTTQQYFDPEDELDELGYRKDRDISRYIMGAGGNKHSRNYNDNRNRGGPYAGEEERVDYHHLNHTRPEGYVDLPTPPQSAYEYRHATRKE